MKGLVLGYFVLTFMFSNNAKHQDRNELVCHEKLFSLSSQEIKWIKFDGDSDVFIRNCFSSTSYVILFANGTAYYKLDREGSGILCSGTWEEVSDNKITFKPNLKLSLELIESHQEYSNWNYVPFVKEDLKFLRAKGGLKEIRVK